MKFLRFGPMGAEKPGVLDSDGNIRDLSAVAPDFQGASVSNEALAALSRLNLNDLPLVEGTPRIGSCVADIPDYVCIGLNYAKHAKETGADTPKEPIVFSKISSALSGPDDTVILPRGSVKGDWEVELGIVIGRECSYVSEEDALDYVSGYCTINDVSEREFQAERGGQWIKGKSAPTFAPTGPWLVTADEVPDPQNLKVTMALNGDIQQNSNTADMIFSVREIISYCSQMFTLRVGTVIATGTPEGVGLGQNPQKFLKAGDTMRVEVEGLGVQNQTVASLSS